MPNRFGYANVGTFGLAHSLLAWARCRVWCNTTNSPMLAPNWFHVQHRIGPLLRRERDQRQYQRLFHFPGYIVGMQRLYLLTMLRRVSAENDDLEEATWNGGKHLVVFSNRWSMNEETHFREIVGYHEQIRFALESITKKRYLPPRLDAPHVSIHVRLGDFRVGKSSEALREGSKNARLPLEWYCSMLGGIRNAVGDISARVYSDGSDEDLRPLLSMPKVVRSPAQTSITDLLSIAQSRVLISSGSGFSLWGAYLGGIPRICSPGQRFARVLPSYEIDLEPECERPTDLDVQ